MKLAFVAVLNCGRPLTFKITSAKWISLNKESRLARPTPKDVDLNELYYFPFMISLYIMKKIIILLMIHYMFQRFRVNLNVYLTVKIII